jgi:hypothetical protein
VKQPGFFLPSQSPLHPRLSQSPAGSYFCDNGFAVGHCEGVVDEGGLIKNGMTESGADFVCLSVAKRASPRKITSIREYQDAWLICYTMEAILTTLDDGSEAAAFCALLGQVVIDYEDSYRAEFSHWPLNASTPEMTYGQTGSA